MEQKKSDYAIIVTCTPGYGFGLLASMNAQNFFKTDADWEIAYDGFTPDYREKLSNSFPFRVNWTPVKELVKDIIDRRTPTIPPRGALNGMWLSYWLMALKVLREKKYKAICVIQADTFVFVNLDVYFKIAEAGILVCGEHGATKINAEDLPFGNDKGIWDRNMCGLFDAVNFMSQEYVDLPADIVNFQCEDAFQRESNGSVVAVNRGVAKYGKKNRILRLDRNLWTCDHIWADTKLRKGGRNPHRVFNSDNIQLNAWHCRWWQKGRVISEFRNNRKSMIKHKDNKEYMKKLTILDHNFGFTKSFMEHFVEMKPELKSGILPTYKGVLKRPRYDLGEEWKEK